jgi:hypothetical protein
MDHELQDFLTTYCNLDEDLESIAVLMRSDFGAEVRQWLEVALDRLLSQPDGLADDLSYATGREFDTDAAAALWLQDMRRTWFPVEGS